MIKSIYTLGINLVFYVQTPLNNSQASEDQLTNEPIQKH